MMGHDDDPSDASNNSLSQIYANILKQNMYMISASFKKSETIYKDLDALSATDSLDTIKTRIDTLLSRMYINLTDFRDRFNAANVTLGRVVVNGGSSGNGSNSKGLDVKSTTRPELGRSDIVAVEAAAIVNDANNNDQKQPSSEDDNNRHQQKPSISNTTALNTADTFNEQIDDDLNVPLATSTQLDETVIGNNDQETSAASNPFDCSIKSQEIMELMRACIEANDDDNNALMTTQKVVDANEDDAEQALLNLEADDVSTSDDDGGDGGGSDSGSESDFSTDESLVWTTTSSSSNMGDDENEDIDENIRGRSNHNDNINKTVLIEKNVVVKLTRIDDPGLKRKLTPTERSPSPTNNQRKRRRILSTSSSSTSGSTTPSLDDVDDFAIFSVNNDHDYYDTSNVIKSSSLKPRGQDADEADLAEAICQALNDDDDDTSSLADSLSSSSSSSDDDDGQSKRKNNVNDDQMINDENTCKVITTKTDDNDDDDDDVIKPNCSWRNDPLLRYRLSSSSSSSSSEDFKDQKESLSSSSATMILSDIELDEAKKIIIEQIRQPNNTSPKITFDDVECGHDNNDVATKSEINISKQNLLSSNILISDSSETDDNDDDIFDVNSVDTDENDSDVQIVNTIDAVISPEKLKGRRNIRALMCRDELTQESQVAQAEEQQRIQRLEQRSKTLESSFSENEFILDVDLDTGKPLVTVHTALCNRLKPHQLSGIQFMWECCYEDVKMVSTTNGSGCILAHCMGLGKTLQVITLLHTLFAHNKITLMKHALIVCPLSTVLNWKNEFRLAFRDLTDCEINFNRYYIVKESNAERLRIINQWHNNGGILVMGYESYELLTNDKKLDRIRMTKQNLLVSALIDPGPDIVVCDEGHILKNGKTLRTRALMKLKTKRRIVLTGTPLQNNLQEYYYMVQFIKPNLLGTFKEYSNRFVNPIMNGQFNDSTPHDINLMKKRTHVLNKILKKTVQRFEVSELNQYLPEIRDYALFITLHPVQMKIYQKFIDLVANGTGKNFLSDFNVVKYICIHPYVFNLINESNNTSSGKKKATTLIETDTIELRDALNDTINHNLISGTDWFKDLYPDDGATNIEYGPKLKIMRAILEEAEEIDDKVLIFSSSLVELNSIEHFLKNSGTKNCSRWLLDYDYQRMDGTVSPELRSTLCDRFNRKDNKKLRVFLISHKVGGLGLNLTAANRVILMGVNFNPCYDTQSIYRMYRFGQTKKCFVYRLIMMNTMEEKVYHRCVVKLAVATQVVDKLHVDRHYRNIDLQEMYQNNFIVNLERPVPKVPKDLLLAKLMQNNIDIFKYHEHQTLLENRPDEELNEHEKQLAWDEFNTEQTRALAGMSVNPLPAVIPFIKHNKPVINPAGKNIMSRLNRTNENSVINLTQEEKPQQPLRARNNLSLKKGNNRPGDDNNRIQNLNKRTNYSRPNINNPAVNSTNQMESILIDDGEFNYMLNKFI